MNNGTFQTTTKKIMMKARRRKIKIRRKTKTKKRRRRIRRRKSPRKLPQMKKFYFR